MTLRKIAKVGHPVLRERAQEVSREALASSAVQTLIDDLIETMRDANGAGLAATQVHELVRICVIEVGDNPRYPYKPRIPLTVLVNPVLRPVSEETFLNYEGCLSVPDMRGEVPRYLHVSLDAWDRHGNPIERNLRGITAGTFQHELDHLDGKLFLDRVVDTTSLCTWEEFRRHREKAFIERVNTIVDRWGS